MSADRYHHGDLAETLLQGAADVVDEEGADAVSLRKLGERIGVSRSALYRHFPNKAALLATVAERGFWSLHERLIAERAGPGATLDRFAAMGVAYVSFAVERPALYRLMFTPGPERGTHAGLQEAGRAAFEALRGVVEEGQAAGAVRPGPARAMAYSAWAAVHGLAMLAIDHQIHPDLTWSALAQRVTRDVLDGLAAPGAGSGGD